MTLSKNIRTHKMILSDWRVFHLSFTQYQKFKLLLLDSKYSDPLVITDCDSWKIVFDWKISAYKEFQQINTWNFKGTRGVICSWWTKHPLEWYSDNCTCWKEYDCLWFQMKDRLEEMGFKTTYSSDITSEMQTAYKKKYL